MTFSNAQGPFEFQVIDSYFALFALNFPFSVTPIPMGIIQIRKNPN